MTLLAEKELQTSTEEEPIRKWKAHLELDLRVKNNRTILSKRQHYGPLRIQRPFYPEDNGTCHLYILHPPGGVVGGDVLNIDVGCSKNTATLVTTPAANKFYRSNGYTAWQCQNLNVATRATLEWLPQETILFNGAQVNSTTKILLAPEAAYFGWEIVSFGRPACCETFNIGEFKQSYEIWRDTEPLFIDRTRLNGGAEVFGGSWGLQAQPVMGLLTVVNEDVTVLENAQSLIQKLASNAKQLSVSIMGTVLVCRCLDKNSFSIRDIFIKIWKLTRLVTINKSPSPPRIWAT